MAIDDGKIASDFKDAAYYKPHYVYIMEKNGNLLVHPSLVGKNLKDLAVPVYEAVAKAIPEGTWVQYQWEGKEKNAYVRETKSGLIVGSGYYNSGWPASANPVPEKCPARCCPRRKEISCKVNPPLRAFFEIGFSYRLAAHSVRRMQVFLPACILLL